MPVDQRPSDAGKGRSFLSVVGTGDIEKIQVGATGQAEKESVIKSVESLLAQVGGVLAFVVFSN